MKNNFFLSIVFLLLSLGNINAEELNITAKEIDIDDKNKNYNFFRGCNG